MYSLPRSSQIRCPSPRTMSGGPDPSVSHAECRVKWPQRWLRAASAYVEPDGVCVGPAGSLKVSVVVVIVPGPYRVPHLYCCLLSLR